MNKFDIKITPNILSGLVPAIGSKSDIHRLLICAGLCDEETVIKGVTRSDDIDATAECLRQLGVGVEFQGRICVVTPNATAVDAPLLNCRESGSTLRFMLPVAAALSDNARFVGSGRLPKRPIGDLVDAMEKGGVKFSSPMLPLEISGKLTAGEYLLPGNVSSQYVSGLLMALSITEGESEVVLTSDLESTSYVNMTISTLSMFGAEVIRTERGYKISGQSRLKSPGRAVADGDWSNAAFFICAGAFKDEVTVTGLDPFSAQGDKKVCEFLKRFGAAVISVNSQVTVSAENLLACDIDLTDTPDLLPILAVVAASAKGTSRFSGAKRLKLKESDRLLTVADMINSLGGDAKVLPDGIIVTGKPLVGGVVDSHNDHRIVMAAAIASTLCQEPVIITNAQAVNKSYPTFFEDFKRLGGDASVI